MFRQARIKLTLWYLALILFLSLLFSSALYRVSIAELTRDLNRQAIFFDDPIFSDRTMQVEQYNRMRLEHFEESRHRLLFNLVYLNLVVLGVGGIISYYFARRTLRPIEQALQAQNTFAADASHELRTPLAAMKAEIEVALRDHKLALPEAKQLLKSNLEEIDHLNALAGSLLKLAGQNSVLDPELVQTISFSDVVDHAVRHVTARAESKNVPLKVEIQDGELSGDPSALRELITILVDNAIKYSAAQQEIRVSARRSGRMAIFVVQDHGQGIAPQDLPHIFDRFYRAESSRSKNVTSGYGLGLAIAKKITDLHHGKISVESTPKKGTTFTVQLPLKQSAPTFF